MELLQMDPHFLGKENPNPTLVREDLVPLLIPDDLTRPSHALKEDHILLMQGGTTGDERKPLLFGR